MYSYLSKKVSISGSKMEIEALWTSSFDFSGIGNSKIIQIYKI